MTEDANRHVLHLAAGLPTGRVRAKSPFAMASPLAIDYLRDCRLRPELHRPPGVQWFRTGPGRVVLGVGADVRPWGGLKVLGGIHALAFRF